MRVPWPNMVFDDCEYFVCRPSVNAQRTLLHPLRVGVSHYLPGYVRRTENYDRYLVVYVERGTLQLRQRGKRFTATDNQFLFIDNDEFFYTAGAETRSCFLLFDGPLASAYYQTVVSALTPVFSIPDSASSVRTIHRIYQMCKAEAPVSETTLHRWITGILTDFIIAASGPIPKRSVVTGIQRAIHYINNNLEKPMTIRELAEIAKMSEFHFIRSFSDYTGQTPHNYLVEMRLNLAQQLLLNSPETISRISEICGFARPQTMYVAFKRNYGMSPKEFRRDSLGRYEQRAQALAQP
ncbi:helix-turn-helix transcriptional regulator [Bifidobacterium sp. 82T10]|uniref:Helix-turn-helix transcriptional regulator n=1 Tax=Bifidobacterium miconis TaxID=2834435 RepID=A0ABS6WFR4_9BIFI|nr:AraC family transcriptional regulator [Bifidobacterium miconis]MBW3092893.1 helix-turn-helix transcriptional regulator [Bifidobacterium miconis]